MFKDHFIGIIQFAIEKEQEAVDFYKELQALVKFQNQKEMLLELQHMEEGHITVLENMLKEDYNNAFVTYQKAVNIGEHKDALNNIKSLGLKLHQEKKYSSSLMAL